MKKVTKAELENLQTLNTEFSKARISIGDLEITKQSILEKIDLIKSNFSKLEKELISKYGEDAVVNISTGEITEKQKE
tara:strand:- start:44 stop:277 length:234 start_codon:yes stop_codon:yes gene_type:complete